MAPGNARSFDYPVRPCAGSPFGPVCIVQASAFGKSASCPCVVCELACYRVVLDGWMDGWMGMGMDADGWMHGCMDGWSGEMRYEMT